MSACTRFEDEALALLEKGSELDPHFQACPECLEARRVYERLQAEIRSLGSDLAPHEHWEAQVWRRIHNQPARRQPLRRWWLALPAAAGLAAVAFLARQSPRDPGLGLAVRIEHDQGDARRGHDARPGDRLSVEATLPPARYAQVRVYQNESKPFCEAGSQHDSPRPVFLQVTCRLESAGRYQVLVLMADRPLPATLGTPDQDAGAALAMGARVRLAPDIHVQ